MADKLPYFPFYADDWLSDEKLRACSSAAIGLWIDMLSLMHKNDRRGFLQLNGKPVTASQLSRMTGRATDEFSQQLAELLDAGVPSATEDGILYSRRMVRDERVRQVRSEAGRKGGTTTGRLLKQNSKQNRSKRASKRQAGSGSGYESDSDSCICPEEGVQGEEPPDLFATFWEAYPRHEAKKDARKAWDKLRPDDVLLKQMLEAIEKQKLTDGWMRGFAPHAATWLNGERWKDEARPAVNGRPTDSLFSGLKDTLPGGS